MDVEQPTKTDKVAIEKLKPHAAVIEVLADRATLLHNWHRWDMEYGKHLLAAVRPDQLRLYDRRLTCESLPETGQGFFQPG